MPDPDRDDIILVKVSYEGSERKRAIETRYSKMVGRHGVTPRQILDTWIGKEPDPIDDVMMDLPLDEIDVDVPENHRLEQPPSNSRAWYGVLVSKIN